MRTRLPLLLVVLASLLAGCAEAPGGADPTTGPQPSADARPTPAAEATVPPLHPSVDGYPEAVVALSGPDGRTERVAVKVAATAGRRQHGLMEVEDLPGGTGMLFVFEADQRGAFWMKDTLIPLDIAFAASDGDILEILSMEPCERDPCERYDPEVTYRYALEVPAGWFAQVGVDEAWRIGDLPAR